MEGNNAQTANGHVQRRSESDSEEQTVRKRTTKKIVENADETEMLPRTQKCQLTERIFIAREAPLTELFDSNLHLRTVYHLFVVILIVLFLNTTIHDFFDKGVVNIGQRLIFICFGKLHIVGVVWMYMQMMCLAAFLLTTFWASVRLNSSLKGPTLKVWDFSWILIYAGMQIVFAVFASYSILHYDLPLASSNIVSLEMVRIMMKIHSFVRNCAPRVLHKKRINSKDVGDALPSFSHFLYFLFAPTLLYRDSYPRTTHVRLWFVLKNFSEVIGTVFLLSFVSERFMFPTWSSYGLEKKTAAQVASDLFTSSLPGILTFLCGFFCLLHAWHNAFAEMLRFADRQFYKEWWITSQFGAYYRMWNALVHDWLRAHVYNEMLPYGGRSLATSAVFVVSAVVHEIVLCLAFRFFYPVLFILFAVFGLSMIPLTQRVGKDYPSLGNLGMWLSLVLGNGILYGLYSMEHFARQNCDTTDSRWWKPVSWSCPEVTLPADWKFTYPFQT